LKCFSAQLRYCGWCRGWQASSGKSHRSQSETNKQQEKTQNQKQCSNKTKETNHKIESKVKGTFNLVFRNRFQEKGWGDWGKL
jgi:ribosome-binding protein aMBF1 (putative translation factor)